MEEDDELQIEVEALKIESEACLQMIEEKKGQIMSMSQGIA